MDHDRTICFFDWPAIAHPPDCWRGSRVHFCNVVTCRPLDDWHEGSTDGLGSVMASSRVFPAHTILANDLDRHRSASCLDRSAVVHRFHKSTSRRKKIRRLLEGHVRTGPYPVTFRMTTRPGHAGRPFSIAKTPGVPPRKNLSHIRWQPAVAGNPPSRKPQPLPSPARCGRNTKLTPSGPWPPVAARGGQGPRLPGGYTMP